MALNVKTLAKLSDARVQVSQSGLKKSGRNTFSNYDYYELKDFLPKILEVCKSVGLCPIVTFGAEQTKLTIYDTTEPDSFIEFCCDSVKALVKGAADIQNEGAKQTYLRRYLYMTAFEIAEADLKLRGPGDLEGTQQSGIAFDLKIADIARDGQIVQMARDEAQKIIDDDPLCENAKHALLWKRLKELRKTNINWAAIS